MNKMWWGLVLGILFVGILGKFPLPIEVLPMAQGFVARKLIKLRAQPVWREGFVTDNGNEKDNVEDVTVSVSRLTTDSVAPSPIAAAVASGP